MSREDPQLRIRLPIELKEKIQELANKNNRSMNAEITSILEKHVSEIDLITDTFVKMDNDIDGDDAKKMANHLSDLISKHFMAGYIALKQDKK